MGTQVSLDKAPSYEYVGELQTNVIYRQGRVYKLHELTDKKIARLLEQDAAYWGKHFQLKSGSSKSTATPPNKKDK